MVTERHNPQQEERGNLGSPSAALTERADDRFAHVPGSIYAKKGGVPCASQRGPHAQATGDLDEGKHTAAVDREGDPGGEAARGGEPQGAGERGEQVRAETEARCAAPRGVCCGAPCLCAAPPRRCRRCDGGLSEHQRAHPSLDQHTPGLGASTFRSSSRTRLRRNTAWELAHRVAPVDGQRRRVTLDSCAEFAEWLRRTALTRDASRSTARLHREPPREPDALLTKFHSAAAAAVDERCESGGGKWRRGGCRRSRQSPWLGLD